jgi:glucose/arabinose dehydrogenase
MVFGPPSGRARIIDPESVGQSISAGPEAIATNLEVPRGIAFGPGGKLCVRTGKAGNRELAQDRSSLGATFFVSIPTARSGRTIPMPPRRCGRSA